MVGLFTSTNTIMIPEDAIQEKRKEEQIAKKNKDATIYSLKRAVAAVIDDYEKTASTVDELTATVDGVEETSHSDNVQQLKEEVLSEIGDIAAITPPWEEAGYDSKDAWLNDV